jgi:hypothetical protein
MIQGPVNRTRMGMRFLAGILGLSSVWILTTELVRPTLPFFPNDAEAIGAAAAHQSAAKAAAWIGLIQGKLWTGYAMTVAPDLSGELAGKAPIPSLEALDSTRFAAAKAAEFAPSDARAWLLLAGANFRQFSQRTAGPLKMSYYTGPNELPLPSANQYRNCIGRDHRPRDSNPSRQRNSNDHYPPAGIETAHHRRLSQCASPRTTLDRKPGR